MATAFDTLSAAEALEDAGMKSAEAKAVAKQIRAGQGDLATKADIAALKWIAGSALTVALGCLAVTIHNALQLASIIDRLP
ncbi:MAG: hypothetical protein OXH14_11305 [Alphaproteobacteria bacterium]|nr:hypothetical protein [Alphaproteobacteria bacterium]MDE0685764.1 hypothetical protein [Candidatus Poribacteria bacterium]